MSGATKDLIADTIAEMAQQTGADKLTVKTVIEKSAFHGRHFIIIFRILLMRWSMPYAGKCAIWPTAVPIPAI